MDHISIVIVHYNATKDTLECLDSLAKIKAKSFKYHIVLVDNGSKEILELPKHLQKNKDITLIRSEANLGFTGGNNLGITHALDEYNSDYVLLLNNDTTVNSAFLENLYAYARENPKAGLINPKIYFYPGNEYHLNSYTKEQMGRVLWYAGGSIDWQHLASFHRGVDEVDRGHFDGNQISDFATGCCLLIRREVIETIGLLDDSLFLYSEDVEYCLRARGVGYYCVYVPSGHIWHKNAGSSDGAGSPTHVYYQTRNRLRLGFQYGDWKTKLTVLRLATRFLMDPLKRKPTIDFLLARGGKQPIV